MKNHIRSVVAIATAAAGIAAIAQTDEIVTTNTVVTTTSRGWKTITFERDPDSGDISVRAVYVSVEKIGGRSWSSPIRDVTLTWAQATNISPSLALVRDEFRAAMPLILTNSP